MASDTNRLAILAAEIIAGGLAFVGLLRLVFALPPGPPTPPPPSGSNIVPPPSGFYATAAQLSAAYNASNQLPIAYVRDVFERAAYSANGFYTFYHIYEICKPMPVVGLGVIVQQSDLSCPGAGSAIPGEQAITMFKRPIPGSITFSRPNDVYFAGYTAVPMTNLTDVDVHNGAIFDSNGNNLYKVLLLGGHMEYVTQQERDNVKRFVQQGGSIVCVNSNNFFVAVTYNNGVMQYLSGHDWNFDGNTATLVSGQVGGGGYWPADNMSWLGSNYPAPKVAGLAATLFGYVPHEENLFNNDGLSTIIIDYGTVPKVCCYKRPYGSGRIYHTGIYGTDVILTSANFQNLVNYLIWSALAD